MSHKIDVLIIGAGAAGLMCAIEAGKRGRTVIVLEKANKPGKKILMSGGGRCNFTNLNIHPNNYLSNNKHFCKSALSRFTQWDFIGLVEKHHIPYHEKTLGQLFCNDKSKAILDMLLSECNESNVAIRLNQTVQKVKKIEAGYLVETQAGAIQASSLVIACGGLSIPTLGSSPFGFKVAEQFEHKVHSLTAGLVPFTLHKHDLEKFEELHGVSQRCKVSIKDVHFIESMLFTHRGLSGPAMLQISSYWTPGTEILIDFLPDMDIFTTLLESKRDYPKKQLKQILSPWMTNSLIKVLLGDDLLLKLGNISNEALKSIANRLSCFTIKPNATEGYRTAEVTRGGVDCDSLSSKTFESKFHQGLYFIGEVVDVTGWLGGYNFQWAWSSGWAAGQVV